MEVIYKFARLKYPNDWHGCSTALSGAWRRKGLCSRCRAWCNSPAALTSCTTDSGIGSVWKGCIVRRMCGFLWQLQTRGSRSISTICHKSMLFQIQLAGAPLGAVFWQRAESQSRPCHRTCSGWRRMNAGRGREHKGSMSRHPGLQLFTVAASLPFSQLNCTAASLLINCWSPAG